MDEEKARQRVSEKKKKKKEISDKKTETALTVIFAACIYRWGQ